ncbi:MAG: pyruvate dehydrogenase [Silicimonas sp.]|nr:pyruvate dehydrogenase [Silicimonas sp.]
MPHEVIMPALGMAQETGLIVTWLKQPGDAVKAGEPLMEVETDKATMEVEAAADGFLTDLRASAGDNVPVGDIVALISESADAVAVPADDPPAESGAPDTPTTPSGREVIMPALGMAQDSGKLVAWLKEPGAVVAEGDALLEVETDKATMEVEADTAGYLAAVYAAEGEDVPVGQVIAVISPDKPDAPVVSGISTAPPLDEADEPPAAKAAPEPKIASVTAASSGSVSGRILASPRARRLATERGLDLSRLVDAGFPQPFHVSDLDTLAALPAAAPTDSGAVAATQRIEARVSRAGFDDFTAWLGESGDATPPSALLVALACGAMRRAIGAASITLRLDRPDRKSETFDDADLAAPVTRGEAAAPTVILRDLTGSRLTAMSSAAETVPVLCVAPQGAELSITLDVAPDLMDTDTAAALADGFAARLENPLRQLF